jgi:ribonuclease HI
MSFALYTDGSAIPNPGDCGCGAVLVDSKGNIVWTLSEYLGKGTNNIGELTAILRGCQRALELNITSFCIFSDSELCVDLVKGTKTTTKEHLNLILKPILVAKRTLKFEIEWIKAHADHTWNEYADKLANNAAKKQLPPTASSTATAMPSSSHALGSSRDSHSHSHSTSQGDKLYLKCSFNEKDQVKQMGARWDPDKKSWWVKDDAGGQSRKQFSKWL